MRRALGPVLLLAALAAASPRPAFSEEKKKKEKEESPLLVAGRKALAEGRIAEARSIFLEARALRPEDPEIVGDLLRVDAKDPEARFLWTLEAVAAASDPSGRAFLPRGFPSIPAEENAAVRGLLLKRASALSEVRKAAKASEGPTMGSVQAWLRRIAERLADGSPVLRKEHLGPVAESAARSAPDTVAVQAALSACMERGRASGRALLGLEAARILRGLRFQAAQRAAAASARPKPGGDDGLGGLDAEVQGFREQVAAGYPKPFTAEEILAIPASGGPEFQALHSSWENPGMAMSPKGLYRIETTGGLQTLQEVVRDVERCHARIARWCGQDPFGGQQGRVRLRPTYADMESDGAPHWWAGGWQQGRLTTIHTCFTDPLSLSGTLTHELTHRFDGALHPGAPAWLMEGRAVHAETCTSGVVAGALDESRYAPEALLTAFNAGIADPAELAGLLDGSRDYRDNYTSGYALWFFLTSFRGIGDLTPEPVFASRIPAYFAACAAAAGGGGKEAEVARFKAAFVDGAEGRPATLRKFGDMLGEFLHGVVVATPEKVPAWVAAWQFWMAGRSAAGVAPLAPDPPETAERGGVLFDRSNWPRSRVRSAPAEPGTDQARRAAALFHGEKLPRERVLALEWAVARDDTTVDLLGEAAEAHAALGEAAPAWAIRRTAEALFHLPAATEAGPVPKEFAAALKAAAVVVEAWDAETDRALSRGQGRLALALRAERDDLAALLGLAVKGLPEGAAAAAEGADPAPLCGPWTSLVVGDLVAATWAPLAPKPSDLFHRSGDNSLVLGSTRDATGDTRTLWYQGVFAENPLRIEGTYSIETAWRATSPFFEALLVVGKEGDDRGFTVTISGGDVEAAIRRERSGSGIARLQLNLSDARPLEDRLSANWREVDLSGASPTIRLGVVVSGPSILVSVNGVPVLRHRRLTGTPIRGTVGFGVRHGTVEVVNPRFRRHRAAGDGRRCACGEWDAAIPWDAARSIPFGMLVGRRLEPAAASPGGGLLFWFTEANLPFQMGPKAIREILAASRETLRPWSSGFETMVSFPPAGRLLSGSEWTPPEARELGLAPGGAGVHGLQPEFAGKIWRDAAGSRAKDFERPDLSPEKRALLEEIVGREVESPWCFWIDPDGIVRRSYSGASGRLLPGLHDRLFRYFSGW